MLSMLSKVNKINKELNKKAILFGKEITVKTVYSRIKNPELSLVDNIIIVNLPNKYKKNQNLEIVKIAIDKMYDEIARIEIEKAMEETRIMLNGLAPENFEIKRIPNKLAKMTWNKTLIINPEIVKYERDYLKNILIYEFCHLKYKTNCRSLYDMVKKYSQNFDKYNCLLKVA